MKSTALLLAACLTTGAAHAEFLTGNDLFGHMRSTERLERGLADGYIMGVHDLSRGSDHCSPASANLTQVRDIVTAFLISVPAKRHLSADVLVLSALMGAFPCPKSGGGSSGGNRSSV